MPASKHNDKLKPPLKWAGGKRWLVPQLAKLWVAQAGTQRLVEPFCGGLAVSLGLRPTQALLNDINTHAINFYLWLKKGLHTQIEMRNDKALFYRHREEFNRLTSNGSQRTKKSAELFYYLNRTGYNGLCRFNRQGGFNVPFGQYKTINYLTDFAPYKHVLANWSFTHGDFERLTLKADDFVYADPPYDVDFTQYAPGGFDWSQQERLAQWLSDHVGPVIVSNQATPRIVKLYRRCGFRLRFMQAPRMISRNGDRTPATEVLATKNI